MCQKSNHPDYKVGDIVEDRSRLQQYAFGPGPAMRRIDPSLAPISLANGLLGMPRMTARSMAWSWIRRGRRFVGTPFRSRSRSLPGGTCV